MSNGRDVSAANSAGIKIERKRHRKGSSKGDEDTQGGKESMEQI